MPLHSSHDTPAAVLPLALHQARGCATSTEAPGQWVRCTPHLILAGVDCGMTPRRAGDGTYSHDHFIAHGSAEFADRIAYFAEVRRGIAERAGEVVAGVES